MSLDPFLDPLRLASIVETLDRAMRERADPMSDALCGVLIYTVELIEETSERALAAGVPYPDELLLAKAGIDDFLRGCGVRTLGDRSR